MDCREISTAIGIYMDIFLRFGKLQNLKINFVSVVKYVKQLRVRFVVPIFQFWSYSKNLRLLNLLILGIIPGIVIMKPKFWELLYFRYVWWNCSRSIRFYVLCKFRLIKERKWDSLAKLLWKTFQCSTFL